MNGQNGKGDSPRPLSVTRAEYAKNWERAFGSRTAAIQKRVLAKNRELFEQLGDDDERSERRYRAGC